MSDCGSETGEMNLQEFKNTMRMWVELDDEVRSLRLQAKEKDKQKKLLEERLVPYLQNENKLLVELPNGKGEVEVKTRTTRPALSKKKQEEVLSNYFNGNTNKALEVIKFINDQKEVKEKTLLSRKLER